MRGIANLKKTRLTYIGSDVLPLHRAFSMRSGLFKSRERKHLNVQSVRIGRRPGIAHIVDRLLEERRNDFINEFRVDQWAVSGNSHNCRGLVQSRSLIVAVKYIGLASSIDLVAQATSEIRERLILRGVGCGKNDFVHSTR